jgi:hypothetical protein
MKKITIAYWIITGLFAFIMLGSAIPDIFSMEFAAEGFTNIHFPTYMLPFLGIAKTLGVATILIPGFPRLKEWAYAGLVIDLLGATYLIAMSGEPASSWVPMIVPLTLAIASYTLYHKKYRPVLA